MEEPVQHLWSIKRISSNLAKVIHLDSRCRVVYTFVAFNVFNYKTRLKNKKGNLLQLSES